MKEEGDNFRSLGEILQGLVIPAARQAIDDRAKLTKARATNAPQKSCPNGLSAKSCKGEAN